MGIMTLKTTFKDLSDAEKLILLARLSHELTILARDGYGLSENVVNPILLRRINELQHRLTSTIVNLLCGDPKRLPDDVLIEMISESSDNPLALLTGPLLENLLSKRA